VFGQEEYRNNNGDIKLSTKCRFIRSVEQVRKGVEVPKIKKLQRTDMSSFGHDINSFGNDRFPVEDIPF
jgi:hypothetical protein